MIMNKKWFTLVELNIVMWVSIILIAIIISFSINNVVENSSYNRLTYNSINNDINTALRNSMSWFWWKSVSEGIRDEKTLLPSEFMVYFRSSLENDNVSWYYSLIENQKRKYNSIYYTRVINNTKVEYSDPSIFLKKIVLKQNESDVWIEVNNFAIWFLNPTGKTNFYIDQNSFIKKGDIILSEDSSNTINEFITPLPNDSYNIAELVFYNISWEEKFTYKIYRDKQFYISVN